MTGRPRTSSGRPSDQQVSTDASTVRRTTFRVGVVDDNVHVNVDKISRNSDLPRQKFVSKMNIRLKENQFPGSLYLNRYFSSRLSVTNVMSGLQRNCNLWANQYWCRLFQWQSNNESYYLIAVIPKSKQDCHVLIIISGKWALKSCVMTTDRHFK